MFEVSLVYLGSLRAGRAAQKAGLAFEILSQKELVRERRFSGEVLATLA